MDLFSQFALKTFSACLAEGDDDSCSPLLCFKDNGCGMTKGKWAIKAHITLYMYSFYIQMSATCIYSSKMFLA